MADLFSLRAPFSFFVNFYRAREGNARKGEKSLRSFFHLCARVLVISPFVLKKETAPAMQSSLLKKRRFKCCFLPKVVKFPRPATK